MGSEPEATESALRNCNSLLEADRIGDLPETDFFHKWVWETDVNEELNPSVLYNENQLYGLFCCRKASREYQQIPCAPHNPADTAFQLHAIDPVCMTLKQLMHSLDNFCIEWPAFLKKHAGTPVVQRGVCFIQRCTVRFGFFCSYALKPDIMDNNLFVEDFKDGTLKLSLACVRRILNQLVIIYRHFHLYAHAIPVEPDSSPFPCPIRKPHIEASSELFDTLCMHHSVPVGARLRYKNEFHGMYNHISQVVYFHNPEYVRSVRQELDEMLQSGDPLQALPALCELQPEVQVRYEDDFFLYLPDKPEHWSWIVVSGRIYLADTDYNVYYSKNVLHLFAFYMKKTAHTRRPTRSNSLPFTYKRFKPA